MVEAESLVADLRLRLPPLVWGVPRRGVAGIRPRILDRKFSTVEMSGAPTFSRYEIRWIILRWFSLGLAYWLDSP